MSLLFLFDVFLLSFSSLLLCRLFLIKVVVFELSSFYPFPLLIGKIGSLFCGWAQFTHVIGNFVFTIVKESLEIIICEYRGVVCTNDASFALLSHIESPHDYIASMS